MPDDSPFFLTKVECPLCKTINEFETVKAGAYLEDGRDTDFCPQNIQWRFPRYQAYNPLAFFTATCTNCFYTREFNNNFRDWKKDNTFKTYHLKAIKERHLEELASADSVIKKIAEKLDLPRFPRETAILKLHLAVFDELLCDRFNPLDLGRFYLRIGWIFRDMESGENPGRSALKGMMLELDDKARATQEAFKAAAKKLEIMASHINAHFEAEEIGADIKAQMMPFKGTFGQHLDTMREAVEKVASQYALLDNDLSSYQTEVLGSEIEGGGPSYFNHPSFADYLLSLKRQWEAVAVNERDALEKSVHFYKRAFAEGRGISPGNQQIQASYLIAELSRRIGDFDGAREYFNSTIKNGQAFIHQHRHDKNRTVLARKILELAIEQGRANLAALKAAE